MERATQGDPLAMFIYGMGLLPLIWRLKSEVDDVSQPWYADDAGAGGKFDRIKVYFEKLNMDQRYRYLGGFVGAQAEMKEWIREKADEWTAGQGSSDGSIPPCSFQRNDALPVKVSGLSIPNAEHSATKIFSTLVDCCSFLVNAITGQATWSHLDHKVTLKKAREAAQLSSIKDAEITRTELMGEENMSKKDACIIGCGGKTGGLVIGAACHNEVKDELGFLATLATSPNAVHDKPFIFPGHAANGEGNCESNLCPHVQSSTNNEGDWGNLLFHRIWEQQTHCVVDVLITNVDS
eukprot:scaffold15590_cov56-Attheya_sp.AAC.1